MRNLDDLKTTEKLDQHNMRKLLHDFPGQISKTIRLMADFQLPSDYKDVKNIAVCGLGGSSVGGDLLKNFLRDRMKLPLIVNRSYTLPAWVSGNSLVLCVSYSGNTEETLSAYEQSKKRRSKIAAITSGGKLSELAKKDGFPVFDVPEKGIPPRTALAYLFIPQIFIVKKIGLAEVQDSELREAEEVLKKIRGEIDLHVPKEKNIAKKLAEEIYQSFPLVYAPSDSLGAVGTRWKTQINENSKSPCYCELFPELDHNEIMGWEKAEQLTKQFSVIVLRDTGESERMRKRIDATLSLIKEKARKILEVHSEGEGLLSRILMLIYIGDYVSFYLAMLKSVEPTEINSISTLKRRIAE